jgi:hypothetical protein
MIAFLVFLVDFQAMEHRIVNIVQQEDTLIKTLNHHALVALLANILQL